MHTMKNMILQFFFSYLYYKKQLRFIYLQFQKFKICTLIYHTFIIIKLILLFKFFFKFREIKSNYNKADTYEEICTNIIVK